MKEVFNIDTPEEYDTDHRDVLFIEVSKSNLHFDKINYDSIFNIDFDLNIVEAKTETNIIIHGFPDEMQWVDYKDKHISNKRYSVFGKILTRNAYFGIDKINFLHSCNLASFNGMSGGPVFSHMPRDDEECFPIFEGILLRATVASLQGYVLKRQFIKYYLDKQIRYSEV